MIMNIKVNKIGKAAGIKLFPVLEAKELPVIYCPNCGGDKISSYTFVHAYGHCWVNTGEVEDMEDGEFDIQDCTELCCSDCDHEWEVEQ
jgi:hypothetical protein